jgi:ribose-phosphate pyrophosphokinase
MKEQNDLLIIALNSFADRARQVENWISEIRDEQSAKYLADITQVRFGNGEAKIRINETVRGKDVYILADIGNYSITYRMFNGENHMSPDDHFQDIKRAISACAGKAKKITVIMPLLYASRQHRREQRESLDCAIALQEIANMGVDSIITFDAHDPNVQNAIPYSSFDNIYPTYTILKQFIAKEYKDIDKEKMLVIAPDTGAMGRAVYYANMLGLDVGMVYKRRDYSVTVNGKNPIVDMVYTGRDVTGKKCVIVDDMIGSGGSVIDVATELKKRGAKEISVIASFALFNDGTEKFDELHKKGLVKNVYSTNLNYLSDNIKNAKWFVPVDMTKFMAKIIDTLNKNQSISPLLDSRTRIEKLLRETL